MYGERIEVIMSYEFTFVLPCLNEESSLEYCINEIKKSIKKYSLSAEILVCDNNSTDNSVEIAKKNDARVVIEYKRGYGSALICGINNAKGKYCIMGDSDGSYDFYDIDNYINGVRNGFDLIVGNRFIGGIEHDAMSFSHKIGGKALTNIR